MGKEKIVKTIVKQNVDRIYSELCDRFAIPFGDVTPGEVLRRDEIEEELTKMGMLFVQNNSSFDEE
jgi:hypothetical protein